MYNANPRIGVLHYPSATATMSRKDDREVTAGAEICSRSARGEDLPRGNQDIELN
jgi:hypothetical protein